MQFEPQSAIRPKALEPRSTVGIVSLASCVDPVALDAGCQSLQRLSGWKVAVSSGATQREGDFAGRPTSRIAALTEMWQRDDVRAIVCSRGGYGSNYLLPLLDFEALKTGPKAFVGCSDNTSLLLALDRAGIVSFHGPMIASDFALGRADQYSFLAALRGEDLDFAFDSASTVRTLVSGNASGPIIGGCLSVLVTSLGTDWEISTAGKILFLEDVNEKLFRIDRMLMHLRLAGKFRDVQAIIFGVMLRCSSSSEEEETLPQMIHRILGDLEVPIVFGFPSGHVEHGNITLPFGVPAMLHCSESGVRLQVQPATLVESETEIQVSPNKDRLL